MLIDLSYEITGELPCHPYDEPLKLYRSKFLETDKFTDHRLETGMHAGTHIDSPMHLTDSPRFINQYPLEQFAGDAVLLDALNAENIRYKPEYDGKVRENDIVIIRTGHETRYGTPSYFTAHPVLDVEFAQFLISKKIKMAGFDLPSPDRYPFEVHKAFFHAGILIIENLRNLDTITAARFRIYAFPLNIRADSSIARVVAEV